MSLLSFVVVLAGLLFCFVDILLQMSFQMCHLYFFICIQAIFLKSNFPKEKKMEALYYICLVLSVITHQTIIHLSLCCQNFGPAFRCGSSKQTGMNIFANKLVCLEPPELLMQKPITHLDQKTVV